MFSELLTYDVLATGRSHHPRDTDGHPLTPHYSRLPVKKPQRLILPS